MGDFMKKIIIFISWLLMYIIITLSPSIIIALFCIEMSFEELFQNGSGFMIILMLTIQAFLICVPIWLYLDFFKNRD